MLKDELGRVRAAAEGAAGLAFAITIMAVTGYFMGSGPLGAAGYGFYTAGIMEQLAEVLEVPVDHLRRGEYLLTVEARHGNETARRDARFTVD
jgi:hypothetical protein